MKETQIRGRTYREVFEKYAIFIAFILLCILLSVMKPMFLTPANLLLVLNQASINGILAIGVTFVLITAGIDISIGSVVGLAGVTAALCAQREIPIIPSFFMGILSGVLVGAIVGLLVTKGKLAPYIVTLGMMTIIRGVALLISGGRPISGLPAEFGYLGNKNLLGVPIPVIIFVAVAAVAYVVLMKLRVGRYTFAVGGNMYAAEASGINPNQIKMFVHLVSGGCAGLAGIILASKIITGQPNSGEGYELDAIAAAVVGGTSLAGGTGSITGTVIGALIIGVIANGLDLMGVSSYWQQIVKGLIIIAAVLLDRNKKRQ